MKRLFYQYNVADYFYNTHKAINKSKTSQVRTHHASHMIVKTHLFKANITSLSPPPFLYFYFYFIKMIVSSQQMYMCVRGIDVVLCSTIYFS